MTSDYLKSYECKENVLFNKNRKLVCHILNKYYTSWPELKDDLIAVGMIALWKATERYDENREVKFSSFAGRAIRNEMSNEVHRIYGRNESLKREYTEKQESLDKALYIGKDNDECSYHEILPDTVDDYENFDTNADLKLAIRYLPKSNRTALILYYFYGWSQGQIAEHFSMSRSWVAKLLTTSTKMLKNILLHVRIIEEILDELRVYNSLNKHHKIDLYDKLEEKYSVDRDLLKFLVRHMEDIDMTNKELVYSWLDNNKEDAKSKSHGELTRKISFQLALKASTVGAYVSQWLSEQPSSNPVGDKLVSDVKVDPPVSDNNFELPKLELGKVDKPKRSRSIKLDSIKGEFTYGLFNISTEDGLEIINDDAFSINFKNHEEFKKFVEEVEELFDLMEVVYQLDNVEELD